MPGVNDIVITGIGCVTPIGIGREAFWSSLQAGKCGIRQIHVTQDERQIAYYGGVIEDFDGKQFITPRKALKVMSREVQLSYAAAHLAWKDADFGGAQLEPERMGVIYGSEVIASDIQDVLPATLACAKDGQMDFSVWGHEFSKHIMPLWMLRNLPNMPACHVGIAIDARGPNNTIALEEVGSLLALQEAAGIIARDQADLMVVGAIGSRVSLSRLVYRIPGIYDQQPLDERRTRCLPFDARRTGIVPAEGAGAMVLERRSHAVRRGATIYGTLLATASRFGKTTRPYGGSASAIASAAHSVFEQSGLSPEDCSHVSAQGYSEQSLDIAEASAIASLAASIPVTAFSSYFGTAGSACGMLELSASLLAGRVGRVLPTLGYQQPDSHCPIRVCTEAQPAKQDYFLKLSFTPMGQAAAALIQCNH